MSKNRRSNQLRIIGGKWRSRFISFPDVANLRPTPNRIRETLFNWLDNFIYGARCLDCFAGSGALSFEALSRGADFCLAVDTSIAVVNALKEAANILNTSKLQIMQGSFPEVLQDIKQRFDIIFLDPPFHKELVKSASLWLEHSNLMADDCLIYIEAEAELSPLPLPSNWQVIRSKIAGQVGYHLIRRVKFENS